MRKKYKGNTTVEVTITPICWWCKKPIELKSAVAVTLLNDPEEGGWVCEDCAKKISTSKSAIKYKMEKLEMKPW